MGKAVRSGYKHIWGYRGVWKETKLRPGLWKFRFTATKQKGAKSYGNFGKGTTGGWKFVNTTQKIRKTGKGKYQIIMTGYKKPLKFRVKRGR